MYVHYKEQPVNALQENDHCLLWESYETLKIHCGDRIHSLSMSKTKAHSVDEIHCLSVLNKVEQGCIKKFLDQLCSAPTDGSTRLCSQL
jgi:hypothetical protein